MKKGIVGAALLVCLLGTPARAFNLDYLVSIHSTVDAYLADKSSDAEDLYRDIKEGINIQPVAFKKYVPLDDFRISVRPNEVSLTPGVYAGIKFTF